MELTVKLTEQEANLILAGLSELPAKVSLELIFKFKQQCEDQINAAKTEEPAKVEEPAKAKKEKPAG
jgi:hypothetical protein